MAGQRPAGEDPGEAVLVTGESTAFLVGIAWGLVVGAWITSAVLNGLAARRGQDGGDEQREEPFT